MWKILGGGAALLSLVACDALTTTAAMPKCSDADTLALVRDILANDMLKVAPSLTGQALEAAITFELPHATKLEENINKYSCAANLTARHGAAFHTMTIAYDSQLDDDDNHLVQVHGITGLDGLQLQSVLAAAAAPLGPATPLPVVPTPAAPTPASAAEPQVSDGQITPSRAEILDATLPPGTAPRFSQFPATVYTGPAAALQLTNEMARSYRTRIQDALENGEVNTAGEYVGVGWGCGAGCLFVTFVNRRTGQALDDGIGGESGERIIDGGARPDSRLIVSEGPLMDEEYNDLGNHAHFYVIDNHQLRLIQSIPLPESTDG